MICESCTNRKACAICEYIGGLINENNQRIMLLPEEFDEYVKSVNEFSKIAKSISVDKIGFNPIHDFMKNKKSNDFRFRFCPLSGVELKQGDERRIWRD